MSRPVLYYVRHGETDWNRAARLQGRRDTSLNARGREQAVCCGEILRAIFARNGQNPAALDYVASPLKRARETMEGMRAPLGLSPPAYRLDPRLAEMAFGDWEGLTLAEVAMRDPDAFAARERDKWTFVPPNGESYQQLSVRVGRIVAPRQRGRRARRHRARAHGPSRHRATSDGAAPEHRAGRGLWFRAGKHASVCRTRCRAS